MIPLAYAAKSREKNPIADPAARSIVFNPSVAASQSIERKFFATMALLFFLTALIGFVPTSIEKIDAVWTGRRPPFLWVMHAHAALMGTEH